MPMTLEAAIEYALDGECTLFLGSGFSWGLKDYEGRNLPTGAEFARELSLLAGLGDIDDLAIAAQAYLSKFSDYHLAELLRKRFTVADVSAEHELILSLPWTRIYTTNYDDAAEVACGRLKKPVRSVTLRDHLKDMPSAATLCIHINGFVRNITNSFINSQIQLTNESYLSSSFDRTAWAAHFRSDILSSRAVMFVGYSLYDLDVARILYSATTTSSKTSFVVAPDPDIKVRTKLSALGQVHGVGVSGLASLIHAVQNSGYVPKCRPPLLSSLESLPPSREAGVSRLRDEHAYSLLFNGECLFPLIWLARSNKNGKPYLIERNEAGIACEYIRSGRRVVLLHGDLGNGKTILSYSIAATLGSEGWTPYMVRSGGNVLMADVVRVLSVDNPNVLLVFDSCYEYIDEIRHIAANFAGRVSLLLLARTAVHEMRCVQLVEALGGAEFDELDINKIDPGDVLRVVNYIDVYGLWGEHGNLHEDQKPSFISATCGGELQAAMLVILRSPVIRRKFNEVFEALRKSGDVASIAMLALVLAVLGRKYDLPLLTELLNLNAHEKLGAIRGGPIREIMDVRGGNIRLKSAVVARELLRQSEDGLAIVEMIVNVVRRLNVLGQNDNEYLKLACDLVRFGNLEKVLPDKNKRENTIFIYEEVSALPIFVSDPLFWLQYAIARMAFSQYDMSRRHFDQAYAIARRRRGFSTFQIDNHYARFLLESRMFGDYPDAFEAFVEADKILQRQMQMEKAYYPYRVARKYADFYDRFFGSLDEGQKVWFLRACAKVAKAITTQYKGHMTTVVDECARAIRKILLAEKAA